jgi:uncharacterized protein involved in response to NO
VSRLGAFPAAPHRMMFVAGMLASVAGGPWWAASLSGRLWPALMPPAQVAPTWVHAWLMVFGVLGPFIFGFLFTTFPRWQNGPEPGRGVYVPVFGLLVASSLLALAGAMAGARAFLAGVAVACLAWLVAWVVLLWVMLHAQKIVSHAVVAAAAVGVIGLSQLAFAVGLWRDEAAILHTALRVALWGGLLPLVYAVCHRMIPFFTQSAVPVYTMVRPLWWLVAFSLLCLGHVALSLAGALGWLWAVDGPAAALALYGGLAWRPMKSRKVPLLWTLYVAYAWLPLGLGLQFAADLSFTLSGDWGLGRAPLHALGIGFLSSLVLAMATRVTLGHSGRRLVMDRFTVACFLALQMAAVLRVASELIQAPAAVLPLVAAAALAGLAGWVPWALRYGPMLLLPRIDGRAG